MEKLILTNSSVDQFGRVTDHYIHKDTFSEQYCPENHRFWTTH
jgi:hypothetical protein